MPFPPSGAFRCVQLRLPPSFSAAALNSTSGWVWTNIEELGLVLVLRRVEVCTHAGCNMLCFAALPSAAPSDAVLCWAAQRFLSKTNSLFSCPLLRYADHAPLQVARHPSCPHPGIGGGSLRGGYGGGPLLHALPPCNDHGVHPEGGVCGAGGQAGWVGLWGATLGGNHDE
jgi:hypothetical protein